MIDEPLLTELAEEYLKTNGLNEAMKKTSEMMVEVKRRMNAISDKYPELAGNREAIIEKLREEYDKEISDKTQESQNLNNNINNKNDDVDR
ncbi:MAG: hypothetical protein HFJ45_08685 [Clostridia bacterium]|nr:hypothetical protein [Clostridia bacterium]